MTILEARIRRRNAAYKAAHKAEILVNNAAYRAVHREERAANAAAYRASHKEEAAAYYQAHREEKLVNCAAYRESHPEYAATYRADHRDAINAKQRQDQAEFTEWLQILRTNNGCEDCETHEGRLHHHHIDPTTKLYGISGMSGCSLDVLEEELEKCVVLCRPCHNKRHVAMKHEGRVSA